MDKSLSEILIDFKNSKKMKYVLIVVILAAVAASFQWVTTQPVFCNTCHEMNFYYQTWLSSTHAAYAGCLDCHTEPGLGGFIDEKVRGLQELIKHITGDYRIPINATVRVKDAQCTECHPNPAGIPDTTTEVRHDLHLGVALCADCHSRIVHNAPGEPREMQQPQCDSCHGRHVNFPLIGGHAGLSCSECHVAGNYSKIDARCQSCHAAPANHEGLSPDCASCHTLGSFISATFVHPQVDEHLLGGEERLDCSNCHRTTYGQYTCTGVGCHSTNNPANSQVHTVFALTGGHAGLTCSDCHVSGNFSSIDAKCQGCHVEPPTHGELSQDCSACHTTVSFSPSNFSHPQVDAHLQPGDKLLGCFDCHRPTYSLYNCTGAGCHASNNPTDGPVHTIFPLTGNHINLSCGACHVPGNFSNIDARCRSCHEPPPSHEGLNPDCASCHNAISFSPSTFHHPQVDAHFPLGEKLLGCSNCHNTTYNQYTCTGAGCHSTNNPTDGQTHTAFPLTGGHAGLSCSECHIVGNFSNIDARCQSCHEAPPIHGELSQDCSACHTINSFIPSTFLHPRIAEHIPRGEERLGCSSCHRTTYSQYSCTGAGCHSSNNPDDEENGIDQVSASFIGDWGWITPFIMNDLAILASEAHRRQLIALRRLGVPWGRLN